MPHVSISHDAYDSTIVHVDRTEATPYYPVHVQIFTIYPTGTHLIKVSLSHAAAIGKHLIELAQGAPVAGLQQPDGPAEVSA